MGASTEELWFSERENGGPLWSNMDGYEKFNPITKIGNWSKPMLVVQGGRDYRVPLEEGLSVFGTLQRKGIESQFLYFPDENHWVLTPGNTTVWYETVIAFLAEHVLGEEWQRPALLCAPGPRLGPRSPERRGLRTPQREVRRAPG